MAKFFFNIRQDQTLFEDRRGGEFADLVSAWNWAIEDARSMIAEGALPGLLEESWVEICDATGAVVATVPFVRATAAVH